MKNNEISLHLFASGAKLNTKLAAISSLTPDMCICTRSINIKEAEYRWRKSLDMLAVARLSERRAEESSLCKNVTFRDSEKIALIELALWRKHTRRVFHYIQQIMRSII
jgi:hypothetical protein